MEMMNEETMENNLVILAGNVVGEKEYDHEQFGEKFYKVMVAVKRLSGYEDVVPVTVSGRLYGVDQICDGVNISVNGQFRSFNKHEAGNNKLLLSVFAKELFINTSPQNENEIFIRGFVCKKPNYRVTPLNREICDVLVAVNRSSYGKSDYIPCILWGRNAEWANGYEVGKAVEMKGRIQSRTYIKKIGDEEIQKTAYEVSVCSVNDGN